MTSPEDMQAARNMEYIKARIEYTRDDSRQVYLRVTAALAVATLILTQLPFDQLKGLDTASKDALFAALALLVVVAVLDHAYLQKIHHARLDLAECLRCANAEQASQLGPEKWGEHVGLLLIGDCLFGIAGGLLGWVVVALLT